MKHLASKPSKDSKSKQANKKKQTKNVFTLLAFYPHPRARQKEKVRDRQTQSGKTNKEKQEDNLYASKLLCFVIFDFEMKWD